MGADDKNGVFICLECLKKYDSMKVVFFREEETGCKGSSEAVMSFFDDVRFVIQPDRKGNSDLITNIGYSGLCSDEFIEAIEPEKWNYKEESGLMTDVLALKENGLGVSCINVSCGYYNAHSDEEITMKKDLLKCLMFIEHIIEDCTDVYPHVLTDSYFSPYEFEDEVYDMLNHDPTLTPEDLHDMYSTNFPHFGLEDYRRICEDYRMFWCDDEEDIYEEIEYVHYANNEHYIIVDVARIQENDEWVNAVIYKSVNGSDKFVRTAEEFFKKFKQVDQNLN